MPDKHFFKTLWSRRWLRRLVVTLATLIIVGVAAEITIGMFFRARLASAIQRGTGADFSAGLVWYLPPRGVSLHHVRISRARPDGGRDELFSASRVIVKLAEFPKAGQPVIVSLLQVDSPSVTIASAAPPVPAPATIPATAPSTPAVAVAAPAASPAPAAAPVVPPDKFRLRAIKINNGELILECPGQDALTIDNINLDFSPESRSSKVYHFAAKSDEADPTSFKGVGSIDLDDMTLGLSDISLQAKVGAILSQGHLSGAVRHRLEMAQVDGVVNIHGSASIPLNDWGDATYTADLQLTAATGSLPDSTLKIDSARGDFHVQRDAQHGAKITLSNFIANAGKTKLLVEAGKFTVSNDHRNWDLSSLLGRLEVAGGVPALEHVHLGGRFVFTGNAKGPMQLPRDASLLSVAQHEVILYPRDVSIQPPKFQVPIEHINGGPILFHGGIVRFNNLNANYGVDQVLLDGAHITLDDPAQKIALADLRRQIKVDGISGTLICRQPGPQYPAALGKVIAELRPTGSFAIGGGSWYAINLRQPDEWQKPKGDYFFRVSTAGGAFALTRHEIPLTDIHADATISPMLVDIADLRAKALDGTVIAGTKITPTRPVVYQGLATFYNVNLQTATKQLALDLKKPLIGTGYLKINVSGQGAGATERPIDTFASNGEFQIVQGNFGDIQTVRAATSNVTKADQVLDGEAAGIFSVRKQVVTLDNCAVGNPMFALQGSGTVGFDKTLNLHAVAAPLGDWREGLKRSNVPVLEDIGSDIAGGIQQLFAGAQRTLLWDIHISGTSEKPHVEQTAAPAITKPVATLFGQFIRGGKGTELIDELRPAQLK